MIAACPSTATKLLFGESECVSTRIEWNTHLLSEDPPSVPPDLIVDQDEVGEYDVRLVDEHMPRLQVSRRYQEVLKDRSTAPESREFIHRKIQAAKWLSESIEQRNSAILKVARAILYHQRDFLDNGPDRIQSLKIQEIADSVGVHVTTVNRVVERKWIQTAHGIFPLKRFLKGDATSATGCS
jgi:RNA polymerase sigma-54 factor